jgi:hypothetical protein
MRGENASGRLSLPSGHLAGRQSAFPWEAECESDVKEDQPLLKNMVS